MFYDIIKFLHSYWAYITLFALAAATLNALIKFFGNKEFAPIDFRLSLFALIATHTQLLLGIIFFAVSGYFSENSMGEIMKTPALRRIVIEHPFGMVLAIAALTIGYSKHKKKLTSKPKFKILAISYTIALAIVLKMVPWATWF